MKKKSNNLLTTSEIAAIVGLSQKHITRLFTDGKLKGLKIGKMWVMDKKYIGTIERQRKPKTKRIKNGSN